MLNIDKIITDYLKNDSTDYAILINGDWGCGKTYYLTNAFKSNISKVAAPHNAITKKTSMIRSCIKKIQKEDNSRKYKMAYVSLYGLSSADDFFQRVFFGVNGWANVGLIHFLGTSAIKGLNHLGIDINGKDTKVITYIDSNVVIVFDDLERICEEKIGIKEVFGLINSYSEIEKRKVVIACNENVFMSNKENINLRTDYLKYKEKGVRYTYDYKADVWKVYDWKVGTIKEQKYKEYLKDNNQQILRVFGIGGKDNLRTLLFFMDSFEQVFNEVKNNPYRDEVLYKLMVTMLIYTMEYKNGVSIEDLETLNPNMYSLDMSVITSDKHKSNGETNTKEDYSSDVYERYSSILQHLNNNEVFLDYIVSGYLDVTKLGKLINEMSKIIQNEKIKEEGAALFKLRNYSKLEDEEVLPLINKILSYVKTDKYNIYDLMYVYAELIKCDNWHFGGFELTNDIKTYFLNSMERQKARHKFNPVFEMKIPMWDGEDSSEACNEYNKMKSYAKKINLEARSRENKQDSERFMDAAERGDIESLSSFRLDSSKVISISGLDWGKIWKLIIEGNNTIACELCNCIIFITSDQNLKPGDGQILINELKPLLDKYDETKDNRVRAMYISELKKHINEILR